MKFFNKIVRSSVKFCKDEAGSTQDHNTFGPHLGNKAGKHR